LPSKIAEELQKEERSQSSRERGQVRLSRLFLITDPYKNKEAWAFKPELTPKQT
jgi:hypothetical protein